MYIKTITYQRVRNLGNYESERLEITAELDPEDDYESVIENLKATVNEAIAPEVTEEDVPF